MPPRLTLEGVPGEAARGDHADGHRVQPGDGGVTRRSHGHGGERNSLVTPKPPPSARDVVTETVRIN